MAEALALKRPSRSGGLTPYLFVLPALVFFLAYVLYPIINTCYFSLFRFSALGAHQAFVGLANYTDLAHDTRFWTALRNNVFWIIGSLAIQVPIALALAVTLSGTSKPTRALRSIFFSPYVLPPVAVGLIWSLIYDYDFGLLNHGLRAVGIDTLAKSWTGDTSIAIFSLIMVACWRFTGFHMMIILAGVQTIPVQLYEAAVIDGASRWAQFRHVTLPLLKRVLAVDVLLVVVGSLKVFDVVEVITHGGPNYSSEVLATYMYRSAFFNDRMGLGCAIATIMLLLTIGGTLIHIRLSRRFE